MSDEFVQLDSYTTPRTDTGSSTFTVERGNDQLRFCKRWGCAGVGSAYVTWEGGVNDFRQACQTALEESGEAESCALKLLSCRRIVYDNDDSQTGREPEPEVRDCEFALPVQFVRSILDKLTPPLA